MISLISDSPKMKTISSFSLLVLFLAALQLHANASHSLSQEAQLKKFISSRKNSASSTDTFRVRNIADRVAGSLSADSTLSDQSSMKAAGYYLVSSQ